MKRNVCGLDRTVRLTAGTALAVAAFVDRRDREGSDGSPSVANWRILAAYAAGELLITGLLQWCPGNYLLGVDTCEQDPRSALRTAGRRLSPTAGSPSERHSGPSSESPLATAWAED